MHARCMSTASTVYDVDELDDDWEALLLRVNGELAIVGQAPMAQPERTVAVRKLMAVTGEGSSVKRCSRWWGKGGEVGIGWC
jgi:hypothetical protein